jgi:hypothetical protein
MVAIFIGVIYIWHQIRRGRGVAGGWWWWEPVLVRIELGLSGEKNRAGGFEWVIEGGKWGG